MSKKYITKKNNTKRLLFEHHVEVRNRSVQSERLT
jgi:hypothetical protein